MKRYLPFSKSLLMAAAGLIGGTALSQAALLTWQDTDAGGPLDFLYEPWGNDDESYDLSYTGTWDITTTGFIPGTHGIDSIKVWFEFADDRPGTDAEKETANGNGGDVEEKVDIWAGGTNPLTNGARIWDDLEVDGRHPDSSYAEYYQLLDPTAHASIYSDLKTDGKLKYTVELQQFLRDEGRESVYGEDTYLKVAKIEASYETTPRRVPEGGSALVLFGLGLAGAAAVRRRIR